MPVDIVVDFRFGDKWSVREFITPENPHVREFYDKEVWKPGMTNDEIVEAVARVIRDYFRYPLNIFGNPSTEAKLLRYLIIPPFWWRFRRYEDYIWQFPAETLVTGEGVCIDTANLATTLLRIPLIDSYTTVGEVRRTSDDELLGYHAWTEVFYKSEWWIIETTIHAPGVKNMVKRSEAYNKESVFARKTGIYYVPYFSYNEREILEADKVKITLSEKMILGKGGKKEKKQLKKMEKRKQKEIWRAWSSLD